MLLVFDIGNTNMVLGVYKDKELICNFRIGTDKSKTSDEYGVIIRQLFDYEGISLKNIEELLSPQLFQRLCIPLKIFLYSSTVQKSQLS